MEAVQGPLSAKGRFSEALKIAVNAYHLSVRHHGPYDDVLKGNLLLPIEITCLWPHGKILNNGHTCTYICDTASLDRLQGITSKLTILDRGLAWPHVNFSAKPLTVDWIMFREDAKNSSGFPSDKEWFVVSEHVRELLDYNVSQHNLFAARSKVTIIHPDFGSCRDVSLSLIIMNPGDLAVSILRSSYSEENGASSFDSPQVHLMCVAGDNIAICNSDEMWLKSELQHHNVTSQIPHFLLQSIISHVCHGRISLECTKHESFLHSEVTIKEEPFVSEGFSSCTDKIDSPTSENVTAGVSLKRGQQVWSMPITRRCATSINYPPGHPCNVLISSAVSQQELKPRFTITSGAHIKKDSECVSTHTRTSLKSRVLYCPKCPSKSFAENKIRRLMNHIDSNHITEKEKLLKIVKSKYPQWKPKTKAGFKCQICGTLFRGSVTHVLKHHRKRHPDATFKREPLRE